MKKYLLRISFDGTGFNGTQYQVGVPTINAELERVKSELKIDGIFQFYSRLDSGVHALDYPACLLLKSPFNGNIINAFNSKFHSQIRIQKIEDVSLVENHKRLIKSKIYRYYFYLSDSENPILNRFSTRLDPELNLDNVSKIIDVFLGEHDFHNFRTTGSSVKTTTRKVDNFSLVHIKENQFYFQVEGPGFLKNQVRMMVGIIIHFCEGKIKRNEIIQMLQSDYIRASNQAKIMDARGLFLHEIFLRKVSDL